MAALNAKLNAAGAPCTFFRSRMTKFQLSELPAGTFFIKEETSKFDGEEYDVHLTVLVSCLVATAQDPVDEAADPLLIWAETQIMADDTLGGLCTTIEKKETKWGMEEKDSEYCGAVITFDINYRTTLTDTTADES